MITLAIFFFYPIWQKQGWIGVGKVAILDWVNLEALAQDTKSSNGFS